MLCPKCGSKYDGSFCLRCGFTNLINEDEKTGKLKRSFDGRRKLSFVPIIVITFLMLFFFTFGKDLIKRSYIVDVKNLVLDRNSESYINDLYISDEHVYKHTLNKKEKELYRLFLKQIKEYNKTITIDLTEYNFTNFYSSSRYLIDINNAIFMDHPELIHFSYITITELSKNHLKVDFDYVLSKEEYYNAIDEIKLLLNEIKNHTKDLSDYEKVKYVYEWLGYRNEYDYSKNAIAQSAYSAFSTIYSPVCSGFARASQIIFQNIGINSLLISGNYNYSSHEWNYVMLDKQYYYYDVTQSKSGIEPVNNGLSYSGFLFKKHSGYHIHHKKVVPYALGRKYLYK